MKIETIREYMSGIRLSEYELDGVEIPTDEDCEAVLQKINETGCSLKEAVHELLLQIREVLDMGLDADSLEDYM